ncbi:MAG: galactokinase [Acidothermus cellulolyticus]|nr:galactokinase [Acidothermus cellulolyticus]
MTTTPRASGDTDASFVETCRALFVARFGGEPAGIWSAPGRVNLIGEHTDYTGGCVLPVAIDRRTYVAARPRPDGMLRIVSHPYAGQPPVVLGSADLHPESAAHQGWAAYVAGILWVFRNRTEIPDGFDIAVYSTVPIGAGLSSSAALECAVAAAVADLTATVVPPSELARLAQYAENAYVGVPCGILDQMAACVCRAEHALFFDIGAGRYEHIPFAPESHGLVLLVADTGISHRHASGEYAKRRESCRQAERILGVPRLGDIRAASLETVLAALPDETLRRRVRHVVTENERVRRTVELLRSGRLAEIGPLLLASHASLRDDYAVSTPELDAAVEAAIAGGAIGARLTGGGFGGSIIALAPRDRVPQVVAQIQAAFTNRGWKPPAAPLIPRIADGVRRDA